MDKGCFSTAVKKKEGCTGDSSGEKNRYNAGPEPRRAV